MGLLARTIGAPIASDQVDVLAEGNPCRELADSTAGEADDDEPPFRGDAALRRREGITADRIDDHIRAAAAGPSVHPRRHVLRSMVDAVRSSRLRCRGQSLLPTRDSDDRRAQESADAHRRQTDPTGRTEHDQGLARPLTGVAAAFIAVSVTSLLAIPAKVTDVQAAYGTALRMMRTRLRISHGDRVLILGAAGGVGTACVQLAKQARAEVIACVSLPAAVPVMRRLGADHVIDTSTTDFRSEIIRLYGKPSIWGGGGVDVVVNAVGGDSWVAPWPVSAVAAAS